MATFKKTLYLMLLLNSFFVTAQFQGDYAIANWSLSNINGNGSIDTTNEPNSITLTGTDDTSGAGNTNYTNIIANTTQITFSWAYSTSDGASYDYPNIIINNGTPTLFSGYGKSGSTNQSGTMNVNVSAGDSFSINMYSSDGCCGSASVTISNFTIATTSVSSLTIFGEMTTNVSLKVNKNGQVGGGIGILSSGKISN
jgi:hypothetical protein